VRLHREGAMDAMDREREEQAQRHEACAQHIRAALQANVGGDQSPGNPQGFTQGVYLSPVGAYGSPHVLRGSLSPQGRNQSPRRLSSVPRSPPATQLPYIATSPRSPHLSGAGSPQVLSPGAFLSPRGAHAISISVAAQLHGEKRNLRFRFAAPPALDELIAGINAVFGIESRATRLPTQPHELFRLTVLKVFDQFTSQWNDCLSSSQITHGAQFYALQESTEGCSVLPAADDALFWLPSPSAPPQVVVEFGVVPTLSDRAAWTFNALDTARTGYVTQEDLSAAVMRYGIQINAESLFRTMAGGVTMMNQHQWLGAAMRHKFGSGLVDMLFFRGHDIAAAKNSFRAEMMRIH